MGKNPDKNLARHVPPGDINGKSDMAVMAFRVLTPSDISDYSIKDLLSLARTVREIAVWHVLWHLAATRRIFRSTNQQSIRGISTGIA
jgi:hypothetical protein